MVISGDPRKAGSQARSLNYYSDDGIPHSDTETLDSNNDLLQREWLPCFTQDNNKSFYLLKSQKDLLEFYISAQATAPPFSETNAVLMVSGSGSIGGSSSYSLQAEKAVRQRHRRISADNNSHPTYNYINEINL